MSYKTTKFCLFLTILLAPLYVIRFRIGSYPSTLLEVLVALTIVSWITEKVKSRRYDLRFTICDLPVALFLLAAVISVLVSPDKRGALGIFKAYFVEPLLIYLVIKDIVKSKKDWRLVFSALVFSGLWVALLAVFQGLTGWPVFAPQEAALGRAHAVYNTANAVGLYLGPIFALGLGALAQKIKNQKSKIILISYLLLLVFAVLLSKSTGAVVGLVGGLGVLGVLRKKWLNCPQSGDSSNLQMVKLLGMLAALVGIWFFFNISNFTPKNIDPYVRETENTLEFRLCLWEGARNLLLERPIFGAGLSGFKELYSRKYFTCDAEPLEYPHNLALNFWTEMGILGLVGFFGILVVYFKNIKYQISNTKYRWLALGFSAAMFYWLIHGLVDVPYFKNDLALEFWVIVGLVDTLRYYERGS